MLPRSVKCTFSQRFTAYRCRTAPALLGGSVAPTGEYDMPKQNATVYTLAATLALAGVALAAPAHANPGDSYVAIATGGDLQPGSNNPLVFGVYTGYIEPPFDLTGLGMAENNAAADCEAKRNTTSSLYPCSAMVSASATDYANACAAVVTDYPRGRDISWGKGTTGFGAEESARHKPRLGSSSGPSIFNLHVLASACSRDGLAPPPTSASPTRATAIPPPVDATPK